LNSRLKRSVEIIKARPDGPISDDKQLQVCHMPTNHPRIRVILVDDQRTIHLEIGALLQTFADIELVGQGETGQAAVELCDQLQPDVVLMDIAMPVMTGIEAARAILKRHPHIRIIAMTGLEDASTVQEMIGAGAVGYILKDSHPEELANTIRTVKDGKSVFSSAVIRPLLNQIAAAPKSAHDYGLTRREMEILRCMVEGKTNPEIAAALTVSLATVKFHTSNILRKLGVTSRAAAIVLATKQGLVS
jgi:DNA-binding NarL/FixJ family response regulator